MTKPKVLVITPIDHIRNARQEIEQFAAVTYVPQAGVHEVLEMIPGHDAVFTNPNKSKVFLGGDVLRYEPSLKVICTASTGTNHIDIDYASDQGITVLSLAEEREVINRISSTAEHAFALTLAAIRRIPQASESVRKGIWDYEPFIGRQFDHLTVGVVGYGRLGTYYSRYSRAFGAKVLVYDPHKKVNGRELIQVKTVEDLLAESDVISLHVHVTDETLGMVNRSWFELMKPHVLLVNTARGEVVNEVDLVTFLKNNMGAFYATDVIAHEITDRKESPVLQHAMGGNQVLITPHIGGMTREGQEIAYNHAIHMLRDFLARHGRLK